MSKYIVAWLATALVFAGLDAFWLSQVAPHIDKPVLDPILSGGVSLPPAIAFYLIYITGIVILAVAPALSGGGLRKAFLMGAVLGLVAYGAYDLTNQATLRVWDIRITLADLSWGTFASACGAAAGYVAASRVGRR